MRKAILLGVLAPMLMAAAETGAMNDTERAYLLEQLEQSKQAMLASIDGLTDAQWKFKPAPNVWSVEECAEHLILAENYLFTAAQGILKSPEVARPATSNPNVDHTIVMRVKDRSQKATAPEPIVPSGKYATPSDAAKEFAARRDKSIEYVKTTQDDLRTHVGKGPVGSMDAYQFLLLMAAHSARHTAQIQEVQSNSDYPKASAALR